tara:strand:+ start:89 stop:826 length:738 start_codon:yes stop_codon:yes gene_type:complete
MDFHFFDLLIILTVILSTLQTIAGVGILVIGTPILLLMDMKMLDLMSFLLPLSIFNSLLNITFLKFRNHKLTIDKNTKKYFFLLCLPAIFFGLFFLNQFDEYINLNILVSIVIWLSLSLPIIYKNIYNLKILKKILIFLTGFVHGITNSGGSLLSLLLINVVNKKIDLARIQIIFFYLFLALFQYVIIVIFTKIEFLENLGFINFLAILFGVILGNCIVNKFSFYEIKKIIQILAFISSIFLISS